MVNHPEALALLKSSESPLSVARKLSQDPHFATSERSVRRWRARAANGEDVVTTPKNRGAVASTGSVSVDNDGATLNNVVVTAPVLDDWGPVFKLFNLDADIFEVVNDTVKMSTWQQSKGTEDGSRDTIQLYSYSARFRRISKERISNAIRSEWRKSLKKSLPNIPRKPVKTGQTYLILIADPQLGKKGTGEAVANWKNGVRHHIAEAESLLHAGLISKIHVAFMGDETENVVNSYTNQPHTIELNRSQQLELDYDLSVWTIKTVLSLGLPVSVSSVISNHGEWTRNASKDPVTTRSDNASTYVRRQVKSLFDELEPFTGHRIEWHIGDHGPAVTVDLSGVKCYFSHGYVEKGRGATTELKMKNAVENQILGDPLVKGDIPLWYVAHYHHLYQWEDRGRAIFGCPALEATKSSEYMMDQYGVWSPSGMLGMVVGTHTDRRWSNLNVY